MKTYISKLLQNEKSHFLLILIVASGVMIPILFRGVPTGNDLPHHFQCAFSFYEGIVSGDFYPSWSLNRNYGFGGMELRLYPPISHYSLALFYLVLRDWHIAAWLTITFYSVLGSLGVYLWALELMPSKQAVFAGCFFALLPYHLNQIYNTFFFAEFVGAAIMPFSFLFIFRVCKHGKTSDVIGLAVSLAALILSHLPLTVIGSFCFLIYGLGLLQRDKFYLQIIKLIYGILLGMAASSFFWIKVLQERELMAKTSVYADPYLDYRLHFLLTPIQSFAGLGLDIYENSTQFYDIMLLCAVALVIACTVPFLFWSWRQKENFKDWNSSINSIWLVFLVSVFLSVPFSRVIWDNVTILQEVQFPWRWVTVVCITASVISAYKLNKFIEWFSNTERRRISMIVTGCILAVITFSLSQIVRPSISIPREDFPAAIERMHQDKGFTFWWTVWTRKEAFSNLEKVSAESRDIQIQNWQPTERTFQISEGEGENARISTFYHPNWKATVNGMQTEIYPDKDGAIRIPISGQSAFVHLVFQETFITQASRWLSLLTWLYILLLVFYKPKNNNLSR